ncbi:MAG: hypothetical protein IK118_09950 [Clostridia bacterium]|nr:hypothetical protein [Clostridia bacterium]
MKQRMKKTLALLLGVMLALTVFAPTAFADLYDGYEPLTFVTEAPTLPGYYIDQPVFVNLVRGEINESNLLSMIATSRFYIDPATGIIYQVNSQGTTVYDKQAIEQTLADIEAEMFLGVDRERELVAANRELKIASAFHEALIKIDPVNPNGALHVGDLIEFGGYPQSRVTDADTVAALDALDKTWVSYGYYSGTGGMYDGNMVPGDWMRYADVTYDGARYRAVTFDSYRPYFTCYKANTSNSFQDDNGYEPGNTYYFQFGSLQWRVLDPAAELVMCESLIDSQAYQNVIYKNGSDYYQGIGSLVFANDYATSSIRDWLNDDFYNTAFSEAEKALIAGTALDNSAYSTSFSQYDSASTTDKIFLLSYGDAVNTAYGFSSDRYEEDSARFAQGTDYAKCQGLYVSTASSTCGNSNWWLRLPGSDSSFATSVNRDGYVVGSSGVSYTYEGVRPAFQFKSGITESVNPNGYECTDHKAGAPVETVIAPADCGSAGEKKLTTYCTVCGEVLNETTEPIPATGEHVWKWIVDDEPTCGVAGKQHQECENCDAVQAENTEIPATGEHVWKWVVDDEPTCGSAGKKHQECENCDAVQAENTAIPATGNHVTERQGAKEATATKDGYTGDLVCTVCGKLIEKGETIPATGAKTPVVSGKPHGECCVCYDITGDSLFANIMRFICAFLCFVWAMQDALGV